MMEWQGLVELPQEETEEEKEEEDGEIMREFPSHSKEMESSSKLLLWYWDWEEESASVDEEWAEVSSDDWMDGSSLEEGDGEYSWEELMDDWSEEDRRDLQVESPSEKEDEEVEEVDSEECSDSCREWSSDEYVREEEEKDV